MCISVEVLPVPCAGRGSVVYVLSPLPPHCPQKAPAIPPSLPLLSPSLACPLSSEHLPPPEGRSPWSGIAYVRAGGQHPWQPPWRQHGWKGQTCHTGTPTARQLLPGLGAAAPWHRAGHKVSGTQYRPQGAELPRAGRGSGQGPARTTRQTLLALSQPSLTRRRRLRRGTFRSTTDPKLVF